MAQWIWICLFFYCIPRIAVAEDVCVFLQNFPPASVARKYIAHNMRVSMMMEWEYCSTACSSCRESFRRGRASTETALYSGA